jgi:signal peptidase I
MSKYSLEDIAFLAVDERSAELERTERGKSFLALSAAMVWPGLGHLVSGNRRWALFWFSIWTALCALTLGALVLPQLVEAALVLLPLGVLIEFCQLVHAGYCGKKSLRCIVADPSARMLAGTLLAMLSFGECYAAVSYLQENWFEICYTPTPSMSPNLVTGDLFLDLKAQPFARFSIVAVNMPTSAGPEIKRLCKRVVGLPGETVEITGGGLMIDGKAVRIPAHVGPYIPVDTWNNPLVDSEPMAAANGCWGHPITLGPDEYFVLGDNTAVSDDGRFWPAVDDRQPGATPRGRITGRIVAIVWPPDRWRVLGMGGDQ